MANLWLSTFLGKTGKFIIQFIDSYYFYLVPLVIAYGIFLTISSYNLKRLEKQAIAEIIRQADDVLKKNPAINYTDLIDEITIDWEELIKKHSFFPYVSIESGFWVDRTNLANVRNIIMHDDKKIHLALERNGTMIAEDRRQIKRNLYLEYFHRITRH